MDSEMHQTILEHHEHLISSSKFTQHLHGNGQQGSRIHQGAFSTTSSIETSQPPSPPGGLSGSLHMSEPPSPTIGPLGNFGVVEQDIYRSNFPGFGNFEHLESLGLRTILTLVSGDYPTENADFMREHGIQHFQIPIPANKNPFVVIPSSDIARALGIIQDRRNHPILIHCNKGKHRTGCIVACYRKINEWPMDSIITEYRKYAGSKSRPFDEIFIRGFDEQAAITGILPTPPSSVKDDAKDE
ncbi:hypothetical protein MMC12_003361 [Toensbergia leucococca]|nr:hypothetical protein [Toensbergia leucococca]